jgi:hypothetical protein
MAKSSLADDSVQGLYFANRASISAILFITSGVTQFNHEFVILGLNTLAVSFIDLDDVASVGSDDQSCREATSLLVGSAVYWE